MTIMPHPKPLRVDVWIWPDTLDGWREVTVEVNGRLLASTVLHVPPSEDHLALARNYLMGEVLRRC